MKKLFLLVLVFCICLSFAACVATDPKNLFETTADTDNTRPTPDDVILYQGTYQYGNMQKNIPAGNFMLLGNEVVFDFVRDGEITLLSYNMLTGEVDLYCKDATCKHDTCVAGSLFANLEVYEGKLYGISRNQEDERAPDQLAVVEGDTVKIISDTGGSFFHHEDKLYISTEDSSFMVLEDGKEEPRMILEEYTGYWSTIFENYLYATTNSDIIRVDLSAEKPKEEVIVPNAGGMTDGEYIYSVDLQTSYLYRCAMDGSNLELLVEQEVLLASINFDDEYFYYRLFNDQKLQGTADCYDIYRFPKDDPTQIEKSATLPVPAHQVFTVPGTGKIFVTTQRLEGEENRAVYMLDSDGSNMKKLDIPE